MDEDLWTWGFWDGPSPELVAAFYRYERAAREMGVAAVPWRFYLEERERMIREGWAERCPK
jgi:hypothetical protein